MKNKEIEELLNTMKDKDCYYVGTNGCLYQDLTKEEIGLLLSYIEQLEKENKILRENAEHNDKVVDKVNWENQQLKKQKDDVVEYIKSLHIFSARSNGKTLFAKILNEILRMLGEIDD